MFAQVGAGIVDGGVQEEAHPEEDFAHVIDVLRNRPHRGNGPPLQIGVGQTRDGIGPAAGEIRDGAHGVGVGPLSAVEPALATLLDRARHESECYGAPGARR